MPRTISGKRVVGILCRKFDFYFVSQRGSHVKIEKRIPGGKITTVVPLHRELSPGTLKGILELARIDEPRFWKQV